MFRFITNKPFWINALATMALGLVLVFAFLQLLSSITRHGEHLTVPAVTGRNTTEAIKELKKLGFDVTIQDSVYTDELPRGTVIKQLPDQDATVKVNRTVYLTVNCFIPPMISMPELTNKSLGFALDILQRSHLGLQDTIFRADFMKGSILEQQYRGKKIAAGTKLQWGSKITLVIGRGLEEDNLPVPDILGMKYGEAKLLLDSLGIMLVPVPDPGVRDTLEAFIYKQNPSHLDEEKKLVYIKAGMVMDIWLSPVMKHLDDSVSNKN